MNQSKIYKLKRILYYLYGENIDFLTPNPEIEVICEQERKRAGITPKKFDDKGIFGIGSDEMTKDEFKNYLKEKNFTIHD